MTRIYTPKDRTGARMCTRICGDCLEKAGLHIPNEAIAIIDCSCEIKVGDFVICTRGAGALNKYCKQVKEIGETIIVGTAYTDKSLDYTFEAAEIYGVVTEAFDKLWHNQVYSRAEKGADNG